MTEVDGEAWLSDNPREVKMPQQEDEKEKNIWQGKYLISKMCKSK